MSSGMRVFFITKAQSPRVPNQKSMPSSGGKLILPERPFVCSSGFSTIFDVDRTLGSEGDKAGGHWVTRARR